MKRISMIMMSLLLVLGLTGISPAATEASTGKQLIIVNKKTNKLAFFNNGQLVRIFAVGTGRTKSLTPEGTFRIVSKIKNRPYYKEHIAGGDPKNPLGDRWLGLEVNGTPGTTYAIHGNNNESSIGKYVSSGCIRMHNEEIRWLFPQVNRNTQAVIISSNLSMEAIAVKAGYPLTSPAGSSTAPVSHVINGGKLVINGTSVKLNDPLIVDEGRAYIPLRETAAALGAGIQWNGSSETVTLNLPRKQRTIVHQVGSKAAKLNGTKVALVVPSRYQNNHVMIPLSALPSWFGGTVQWNPDTKTVTIKN
ncbi:stalk domain-containing protein [Paenibacillus sp. JX-17]|uniref:Stalk domain-containing protein n=1 Tax=Paenibacillus lacisoli TaxID=3064525 RepID=A0ABT9CCE8_9BACL|nr:stalk domain-containing protein [Paenibacillus sp. JX-17]MDO7906935.1 stalk domain-containing protein [Paenibacillus sp. JX-17]